MRTMGRQTGSWQAVALALVFVACAASGLAAGMTTRAVAGGALTGLHSSITGGSSPTSATHTPMRPSPSSTTSPATIVPPSGFKLTAVVTPSVVAAGQTFTVVATVTAPDGQTPLAGVACAMGAAPGSAPLFTSWPDPVISDAEGHATWSLTAPTTPGSYVIEISAHGQGGWSAVWRPSVTITG
jgi:hypothetical protein